MLVGLSTNLSSESPHVAPPATVSGSASLASHPAAQTAGAILASLSFCHLLNDMMQSLLPSIYPMLKTTFGLDFWQIGLITLTNQLTASVLQPLVGLYTDRHPKPYSLAFGMSFTLGGLLLLSGANHFGVLLMAAGLVGIGSAIFHPESSRMARLASGGRHGFAQSLFQTGGNAGSSLGPLLAAFIVLPHGQGSIAWFSVFALLGIGVLWNVGVWYKRTALSPAKDGRKASASAAAHDSGRGALTRQQVWLALAVLMALTFSKYIYLASLSSYYTFFLIHKFGVSVQSAQLHLFAFLGAVAVGTFVGGPIGDRFGRKYVIWGSILGVLPFSLILPYASLFWTGILSVIIGVILASAFSAILVFAQELVPGKVGLIAGLFFGFAFGIGGIGAAALGKLADVTSIEFVYRLCAFLPAIGLLTAFLPDLRAGRPQRA
jgi:FSR family fosmidomycin resistance protein-like MFS transporter